MGRRRIAMAVDQQRLAAGLDAGQRGTGQRVLEPVQPRQAEADLGEAPAV